jgi:hypothetical protein
VKDFFKFYIINLLLCPHALAVSKVFAALFLQKSRKFFLLISLNTFKIPMWIFEHETHILKDFYDPERACRKYNKNQMRIVGSAAVNT